MAKYQQNTDRDHPQQNHWCLVLGGCLFLQHYTPVHHLYFGKLDLGTFSCVLLSIGQLKDFSIDICLRGFPLEVVNRISGIICCCFWCLASCYLSPFRLFPPHHHALVEQISRCSYSQPVSSSW